MSRYLIRFTPMEPYFFGNERGLNYPGSKSQYQNLYFVRGENTPLQTTLLGALRFMVLQKYGRKPDEFHAINDTEKKLIGESSFNPQEKEIQGKETKGFGVIQKLSPVFLTDAIGIQYIPVPMDHNLADKAKNTDDFKEYSPFRYYNKMMTADGKKLYTEEYDLKKGVISGFMSLVDGRIHEDLFSGTLRVGINRGEQENGFFKKEYKRLKDGFSFAVYCELDDTWDDMPKVVYLGQGHSAFRVDAEKADSHRGIERETLEFLEAHHPLFLQKQYRLFYCLGDSFLVDEREESKNTGLYDGLLFAVTDIRDFRSMQTNLVKDGKHLFREKTGMLYHLLKAGSVLIAENDEAALVWMNRYENKNAESIGFNTFVGVQKKEETK